MLSQIHNDGLCVNIWTQSFIGQSNTFSLHASGCSVTWLPIHLFLIFHLISHQPLLSYFPPVYLPSWQSHHECFILQTITSHQERPCRRELTTETSSKTQSFLETCMGQGKYLHRCINVKCFPSELNLWTHVENRAVTQKMRLSQLQHKNKGLRL